jgi:NadR type nicotinamide-nucleotide adenylyltransferase
MKKFRTAVVVGKFYPPHRGHKHLIDTALSWAERVWVLVTDTLGLEIPAETRAGWVRQIHPTAEVRVIADIGRDDDSPAWARHTVDFLGFTPEAAFTSEDYGRPWAEAMGCDHVLVDRERVAFPVSGTKVRGNPAAFWKFLEPPVRPHYCRRICVLGAESTGTTTLAQDLARHYRTAWVPEYGRWYASGKSTSSDPTWRSNEFVHIAEHQAVMEDWLAQSSDRLLICDTDPFATAVWHERYIGRPSPEVMAIADRRHYDLYILTGDEIPFVQDGTRDGEEIRHWMHRRFEDLLEKTRRPFIVVRGSRQERVEQAVRGIGGG